ncbi:MAG: sugar nucleotide-binding protein [candidate division Zixibacteria bacterium]|nr:sugar nucleotide-binding protein [candidate division Zixibacteria bacterium]
MQATSRRLRILPLTTADYPTPARRPKWSVLDCSKIQEAFGISPRRWQEGLILMLSELCNGDRSV